MKKSIIIGCLAVLAFSCKVKDVAQNTQQSGWEVLFDGSSLDKWKMFKADNIDPSWSIKDGAMVYTPPKEKVKGVNYNIVTKKDYTNFVLSVDWKISEGGNSGLFWGISEDAKFGQPYASAAEIQVLDNDKHPDGKNGPTRQAGALYDLIGPPKDVTKPVGEWNTCVISINHKTNKGSATLNGTVVAEFPLSGPEWDAMIENSKFKGWDGFAKYKTGKIGFQDHNDVVSFRNVKIKEL